MKARVRGVKGIMPTFDFLFNCSLGERILKQTDNLSKALQNSNISAAQEQALASDVVKVLSKDRNKECLDLFWERVLKGNFFFAVSEPKLPRKIKMPDYFRQFDADHTTIMQHQKTDTAKFTLKPLTL